jgi:hypothetical protein
VICPAFRNAKGEDYVLGNKVRIKICNGQAFAQKAAGLRVKLLSLSTNLRGMGHFFDGQPVP